MIGNSIWLPYILAGIYLLLIGVVTFRTRMFKPFIIYGIVMQCLFLVYWLFTRSKLQGVSGGENMPLYMQFLTVIEYSYCLLVAPIFIAINVRTLSFFKKNTIDNITRGVASTFFIILFASVFYLFAYVFVTLYYGFGP
ncbi:hypothetical protein [Vagococcus fessus]|uniref:Uncharacterized protein n=1 Tax=Vagococcus fessus TaxID=120370 RepID=A0A430ABP5_9ENTE|nr:hypothetical protein [Vagococcus fessus]RSU04636.1 hypothetical protein CBF31_01050 [Vagococcus fessus]